ESACSVKIFIGSSSRLVSCPSDSAPLPYSFVPTISIGEDETESVCSIRFSSFSRFIVSSSPLPAHAACKNNPDKIRSHFFFISYLFFYWTCLVGRIRDAFQVS